MRRDPWTTGDIGGAQTEETHTTWEGHEDEECPPGLNDILDDRQRRTEEEGRQEQMYEDEEDGNSRQETKVRELDARLRRVEERFYDETILGQASVQCGATNRRRT